MKKITLVCFGKLKTNGFAQSIEEFSKRLSRYTSFTVVELKPIPIPEKSETLRDLIPEKEGQIILERLTSPAFRRLAGAHFQMWCMDESGRAMKTGEWALALDAIFNQGSGELVLCIGGSLGIGHNVLNAADRVISFGPQTFSHELARLVLIEQLYRALSFNSGHPYHNEG